MPSVVLKQSESNTIEEEKQAFSEHINNCLSDDPLVK